MTDEDQIMQLYFESLRKDPATDEDLALALSDRTFDHERAQSEIVRLLLPLVPPIARDSRLRPDLSLRERVQSGNAGVQSAVAQYRGSDVNELRAVAASAIRAAIQAQP